MKAAMKPDIFFTTSPATGVGQFVTQFWAMVGSWIIFLKGLFMLNSIFVDLLTHVVDVQKCLECNPSLPQSVSKQGTSIPWLKDDFFQTYKTSWFPSNIKDAFEAAKTRGPSRWKLCHLPVIHMIKMQGPTADSVDDYHLVMTNIAMENCLFIDGLPNLKMVIFHGYLK